MIGLKLAPATQSIKNKNWCDLVTHVFPRLVTSRVTLCICFHFSLVHCHVHSRLLQLISIMHKLQQQIAFYPPPPFSNKCQGFIFCGVQPCKLLFNYESKTNNVNKIIQRSPNKNPSIAGLEDSLLVRAEHA